MSIEDITTVRNKILNLYLESYELQIDGYDVLISGTKIGFAKSGVQYWLNIYKDYKPSWHLAESMYSGFLDSIDDRKFKDVPSLARIMRKLQLHFPYKPTERYLQNGGRPIV